MTCPPPASSAQWPALAAAATILASTVVGVMPASRIGERPVSRVNAGLDDDPAVRQAHRARREGLPGRGHLGRRARGEQVALASAGGGGDDADAGALQRAAGDAGSAGHRGPDPASTARRRPLMSSTSCDPVDRIDQDSAASRLASVGIETALRGPRSSHIDGLGSAG